MNSSGSIKLAVLRNESGNDHLRWIQACNKSGNNTDYEVIDISKSDWLENIVRFDPDILLSKPGALTSRFKQLYDERLTILVKELGYKSFPTLDEVLIYENKRYFSYWLSAHEIPHPKTDVFYYRVEALEFLNTVNHPLVAKVNIGASGSGVTILENMQESRNYIYRTFSEKGAEKRSGPNLKMGGFFKRGLQYIFHPGKIGGKLHIYKTRAADVQSQFVIFQEYVPHSFEWRVVRMGESFFAHKKVKKGDKASGALLKSYEDPPFSLLDFVKNITDRFGFYSQAVDIFESERGYLVNEMQCIFGQSDPYQMLVDGKPGRYLHRDGAWVFEEGYFNRNESYDLRLKTALELYEKDLL